VGSGQAPESPATTNVKDSVAGARSIRSTIAALRTIG
jgi:hypothetical protein